jgi:lysophospholipase L1-like esterase
MALVRLRTATLSIGGLAALLGLAGCDLLNKPTDPTPTVTGVSYTAIGASDTTGYGGTSPCAPFSQCPDGTGYVQIVARRLRAEHADFAFLNLGVPGAVLSREIMTIGNNLGRGILANFIDGELPFVARNSTIVTVFGDGNGVNTIGAALRQMPSADRAAFAQTQIQNFSRDFTAFTAGLAERAPSAQIVVITLPNMARLPFADTNTAEERDWLRQLSVGFSAAMASTRSTRVRVVDLMCFGPIYQASNYWTDGFHPNDAGYAALADLVTAAIATAPAPPATSYSFMS